MHRQFADRNPFHSLEAHYADAAVFALNEVETSCKGKKILAMIPSRGGIYAKKESPKIMMCAGKITKGINEVIQKLNHSFGIISSVTKLSVKTKSLVQPQPQYD